MVALAPLRKGARLHTESVRDARLGGVQSLGAHLRGDVFVQDSEGIEKGRLRGL